jgi:integrase
MSLYKRKTSIVWWCRFQVKGREIRRSTGSTDRRQAEKEERRLRVEIEAAAPKRRTRQIGLADLAGLDIERGAAQGVSASQAKSIEYSWGKVVGHFGADLAPEFVCFDSLEEFVAARRATDSRGQSIRKDLQALKRGLTIARRRGWIREVPDFPKVRSDPPNPNQKGTLHAPAILRKWLAALPAEARDQAQFALLTGLRAAEISRVQPDWVESAPAGTHVPALLRIPAWACKTRRERVVGLTPVAFDIAANRTAHLRACHRKARNAATKQIGYAKNITLRDLRHTYGTLALQGTGDAIAAQSALGHSELATTQRYQTATLARTAAASIAVAAAMSVGEVTAAPQGASRHITVGTSATSADVPGTNTEGCKHLTENSGDRARPAARLLPKQAFPAPHLVNFPKRRLNAINIQAPAP